MKKNLFLIFCISVVSSAFGGDTIYLNKRVEDGLFKRAKAILPVYRYTGQPFEDISNFGAESKKKANNFYIKFPDMTGIVDTFYTFMYSGAANNRISPGYYFVLVGNNKRMYNDATPLWIDRNNNLDLSDDGPPDTFTNDMEYLDIDLPNTKVPGTKHVVRISRFNFTKHLQYKFLLNKHYRKHSGKKEFTSANYSFRESRLNLLSADVILGNDSFTIALKDFDCNGIFNEAETDLFMLTSYGSELYNNPITIPKKEKVLFEWKNRQFIIQSIAKNGSYIVIGENKNPTLQYSLNIGDKLPKFSYCRAQSKPISLKSKKLKKKPVFVYFWNRRNPNLVEDTAALRKLYDEFGDKIHILALNYGDKPRIIRKFRINNGIKWTIGFSKLEINELFHVKAFPHGFLTDKNQRLVNTDISPSQLYELLNDEK